MDDFSSEEFSCKSIYEGHKGDIKMVKFCPNDNVLFSCGFDESFKIWEQDITKDDFVLINTIKEHSGTVWCIEFNKKGDMFFTCSDDMNLIMWKIGIANNINSDENNLDTETIFDYENIVKLAKIINLHSRPIYSCSLYYNENYIMYLDEVEARYTEYRTLIDMMRVFGLKMSDQSISVLNEEMIKEEKNMEDRTRVLNGNVTTVDEIFDTISLSAKDIKNYPLLKLEYKIENNQVIKKSDDELIIDYNNYLNRIQNDIEKEQIEIKIIPLEICRYHNGEKKVDKFNTLSFDIYNDIGSSFCVGSGKTRKGKIIPFLKF